MEAASQNRAGDTEDWSAAYVRLQQRLKSSYQQSGHSQHSTHEILPDTLR